MSSITPQQIIDQAVGAAEAGAAVVHIHGRRKEDGMPTGDPEVMIEIVEGITENDLVVLTRQRFLSENSTVTIQK